MATRISIEEAQTRLGEVINELLPGEELVLTSNGFPVATIVRTKRTSWPCQPGTARNTEHWMAPDFDAPLEDFKEYM